MMNQILPNTFEFITTFSLKYEWDQYKEVGYLKPGIVVQNWGYKSFNVSMNIECNYAY